MMRWCAGLILCLFLAACAAPQGSDAVVVLEPAPDVSENWRMVATPADAERLDGLDGLWGMARAEAALRYRTALTNEDVLLDPAARLVRPLPSPGRYRCRVLRLGGAPAAAFRSFPMQYCFVDADGGLTTIVKETGSQRPAGRLWPDDDDDRLVFLGTDAGPGTAPAPPYGADPVRDLIGVLERVAPFRWRLVLIGATPGARIDVIEMVPLID